MDNSARVVLRHEKRETDLETLISTNNHIKALRSGVDVPEQRPSFEFPLTAVGISGKTVWVRLPQGVIPFSVKLQVDLPSEFRGIHMSRMEESISELVEISFSSISDYARELGHRMLSRQRGGKGMVVLSGKLPITRVSAISEKKSIDSIDTEITASFVKKESGINETIMHGVGLCHITACPCTQVYNQVIFPGNQSPYPTHSQRSYTKLFLEMHEKLPTTIDLVNCLETSLHVTQDLLKRPDEAEIVMKAHQSPQFAEDAVRQTAQAVGQNFGSLLPGSNRVIIDSLSLESIHIHDVCCRLETSLAEICKNM